MTAAREQLREKTAPRRRDQSPLLESEESYRILFASMAEGVVLQTAEGAITACNASAERILGLTADQMRGRTSVDPRWESIHEDGTPFPGETHPSMITLRTGRPLTDVVMGIRKPEGALTWISINSQPIFCPGKSKPSAVVTTFTDITDRRLTEERARTEHAFRKAVEDSLLTGIVAVDLLGRHIHANRAFCRMVGWEEDELAGTVPPFVYWPSEDVPRIQELFFRALQGNLPPEGFELSFRRRNEERFDVLLCASPLTDARGNPAGFVTSVEDITQRKRDAEMLRQNARQLRQLSARILKAEERDRRRISRELHDSIGQTLSAVKFSLERVIREAGPSTGLSPSGLLLEPVVELIRGAIDDVRSVTAELRPSIIDDLGIMAAVSCFCRNFQRAHGTVRLEKDVALEEAKVPAYLKIVIYRVLQEAVNNVARHSGACRARLSLRGDDHGIELTLEDNGRGFDVQSARRGMGLASMRERVEGSGGTFSVESSPGKGTILRAVWRPLEMIL